MNQFNLDQLLIFISSILGASAVVVWIGKLIITKSFDLGIEKYKSTLTKEIESYKNELSKIALEHQVKFTRLHEDRAEKIKKLHSKVYELEKALRHATTFFQGPDYTEDHARDNACNKVLNELRDQLEEDQIYFSKSTINKFETLFKESSDIILEMGKARIYGSYHNQQIKEERQLPLSYTKYMENWTNASERTINNFKELKLELADEFRSLLGL
ncbi:MAG: hypothetical protein J0H29_13200 [Sphingobacteriales bacterium]|uniref:hypothetical protein n=1 Tax=uncultured Dysgonomonas sp. TaxID=206096 RepID=UPI00096728C4|nr:hypothetical protein [uncultured Dysgonomonas sp.]MBN8859343.1 hypothetical protein [Sphingobacteriales bacterium]OJY86334.1 MAG: hypothetical protein BGP14_20380 [Sphingobacteriales bacterium 44-15]